METTLPLFIVFGFAAFTIVFAIWQSTKVSRRILRHLGVRKKEQVALLRGTKFALQLEVDALRALVHGLRDLGLTSEDVGLNAMVANTTPPTLHLSSMLANSFSRGFGTKIDAPFAVAPGKTESLPTGVMRLCRAGEHRGALTLLRTETIFTNDVQFELAVPATPEGKAWGTKLLEELEVWMAKHSVFRGHALTPTATASGSLTLAFTEVSLPPDLVLEERLREDLEQNFLGFVRHRESLARMGIAARRGLLLTGAPGTGKTSTCRYLRAQLPEHTFFLASSQSIANCHELFALAARLAPSVVVIEDVDLAVRTPDPAMPNMLLKDLLNELDGLQDRAEVMVVLTSNSTLPLEQALANRPGRIDHTIRYDPPGAAHRKNLLARAVEHVRLSTSLDELVTLADGLTPAQLTELVKRAAVRAIRRAGADPELCPLDFRAALDELAASEAAARGARQSKVRTLPKN